MICPWFPVPWLILALMQASSLPFSAMVFSQNDGGLSFFLLMAAYGGSGQAERPPCACFALGSYIVV